MTGRREVLGSFDYLFYYKTYLKTQIIDLSASQVIDRRSKRRHTF
jgi:hypothetical protein